MKLLLALSVAAASLSVAAPALAHDCGCKVKRLKAHHTVGHLARASVRRVVVIREPVIVRERVVVREPVYVRERPVIVRERVWRPAPYPVRAWGGERGYRETYRPVRFGYPSQGWRERGDWQHREWRGREGWRDHSERAEGGWRDHGRAEGGWDGHGERGEERRWR